MCTKPIRRPDPLIPKTIEPIATVLPSLLWQETLRGSREPIKELDLQHGGFTWHLTDLVGKQSNEQTDSFSTDFAARVALFHQEIEVQVKVQIRLQVIQIEAQEQAARLEQEQTRWARWARIWSSST
ncbi:hypothetical protein VMCG_10635 [Cytospora schulzeri]|uniref:Uncharacterized protein n=1 Tax=Cytospora schulzeri TaxID=448051 RepID=A0A423VBJ9_9PEZI|nr:hypothetical protein VMCG_10635 [Valsa malicola]